MITLEQAIKELKKLQNEYGDKEFQHKQGDRILCRLLTSLGYKDVVREWARIPEKWWA